MMIVIEVALDVQSPNQRWELKLGRVNIQSDLANIIIITTIIVIIMITIRGVGTRCVPTPKFSFFGSFSLS